MSRVFVENEANRMVASSAALAAESEEYTFLAWAKDDSTAASANSWFGSGVFGSGVNRLAVTITTLGRINLLLLNEADTTFISAGNAITYNAWQLIGMRRQSNGAGGFNTSILANGVFQSQDSSASGGFPTTNTDVVVGMDIDGAGLPAKGKIAHLAMWARALTDVEVNDLAAGTNPGTLSAAGRYAYYPMTDVSLANVWATDSQALTSNGTAVQPLTVTGTVANDDADNPTVAAAVALSSLAVTQATLTPGGTISGTYADYATIPTTLTVSDGTNTITIPTPDIVDDAAGGGTFSGTMPALPTTGSASGVLFGDVTVELS